MIQSGGRAARASKVAGSHPQRPFPTARSQVITPAMRTSQLLKAIQRVGPKAPEWERDAYCLIAAIAVSQWGLMAARDGKGTVADWPMWAIAATAPE